MSSPALAASACCGRSPPAGRFRATSSASPPTAFRLCPTTRASSSTAARESWSAAPPRANATSSPATTTWASRSTTAACSMPSGATPCSQNGGLGIDLEWNGVTANDPLDADPGANRLQNFPQFQSVAITGGDLIVTYLVDSDPVNAAYPLAVEFFKPDSVASFEGKTFVGGRQLLRRRLHARREDRQPRQRRRPRRGGRLAPGRHGDRRRRQQLRVLADFRRDRPGSDVPGQHDERPRRRRLRRDALQPARGDRRRRPPTCRRSTAFTSAFRERRRT